MFESHHHYAGRLVEALVVFDSAEHIQLAAIMVIICADSLETACAIAHGVGKDANLGFGEGDNFAFEEAEQRQVFVHVGLLYRGNGSEPRCSGRWARLRVAGSPATNYNIGKGKWQEDGGRWTVDG